MSSIINEPYIDNSSLLRLSRLEDFYQRLYLIGPEDDEPVMEYSSGYVLDSDNFRYRFVKRSFTNIENKYIKFWSLNKCAVESVSYLQNEFGFDCIHFVIFDDSSKLREIYHDFRNDFYQIKVLGNLKMFQMSLKDFNMPRIEKTIRTIQKQLGISTGIVNK